MLNVELCGLVYEIDGYAECVRNILQGLYKQGINVKLRMDTINHPKVPLTPSLHHLIKEAVQREVPANSPIIQFRLANAFQAEPGRYVIGVSMLESDRINADWVAGCNRVDEVWVPSQFNWETFTKSGAPRVRVMPFGVDRHRFRDGLAPLETGWPKGYRFLATDWFLRKGPDLLLEAYYSAFTPQDDVVLIYKIKPGVKGEAQNAIREIAARHGGLSKTPPVVLVDEVYGWAELPRIYNTVDCFVLPTRGEGWSLPLIEAMASALPVICTNWSGPTQFVRDHNSYLLDIEGLEPIPNFAYNEVCWQNGLWAKPDPKHLVYLLRYVYEHRDEAKAKGKQGQLEVCEHFSWDRAAKRMADRLAEIGGGRG